MSRRGNLIIVGALIDLALTISHSLGDHGLPHLTDTTWFLLDAVALALIGVGLAQAGRACLPFAAGWGYFAVVHVVGAFSSNLLPFLLASGDIVALATGITSAVLNARIAGWNAKSTYLLTAAVAVLSIPLAVAVGGDPGLDIALPLYSVVLLAMGIGLGDKGRIAPWLTSGPCGGRPVAYRPSSRSGSSLRSSATPSWASA
jgi:hypothetical protein